MPKFSVVVTQTSVITVEGPSAEAVDKALEDDETMEDVMDFLDDASNWEVEATVKEPAEDAEVEMRLEDGEFVTVDEPEEEPDPAAKTASPKKK